MADWIATGPHQYLVNDDLLFWQPVGEVLPKHAETVCQILAQLIVQYHYALWLVDATGSVQLNHLTRQVYARRLAQADSRVAMASFGAKLPAVTTATLLTRGIGLLTPGQLRHRACLNEAEARSYLAQQRSAWTRAPASSI